ncbi:MAG TPA: O-methyltransferase [Ktedonobacteraceae bacterium]|nr:O-methyltransferase [Ktedonobacteraceae bacterium]
MANDDSELSGLQQQAKTRQNIVEAITRKFAAEDDGLKHALNAAKEAGLPEIQISPIQGKFLQLLAVACNAQKILEIGSLGGYSGIWLARGLPSNGRFITLEINPTHAEIVRNAFAQAGVSDRAEVRVGNALDLMPLLEPEAPFDLIFIDADKPPYPQYLDWALRLSQPGSIIVADNCVRSGKGFEEPQDEGMAGIVAYNNRIASDPRLISLDLAMDDDYTDGFAISVVRQ